MSGFFAAGRYWDLTAAEGGALAQARAQLAAAGIADPALESRLIWAHVAGDQAQFAAMVAQRAARIPLSHLLGYRDFYHHRFVVTPAVLDPRPDTEAIVSAALAKPFTRVLDLGTGSGCIVLSLLAGMPQAQGVGVDLSDAALAVAAQNRAALGLDLRCDLRQSDWFTAVTGQFDLIVANPPYIAADEMAGLAPDVRLYEPALALTDHADGLSCYRVIVAAAGGYLTQGGRLIVEIGPTQAQAVMAMFAQAGFTDVTLIHDLDGRDRGIAGDWAA